MTRYYKITLLCLLVFQLSTARGQEFEKKGSAISKALGGTKQAYPKKVKVDGADITAYVNADPKKGKPSKIAVVQEALYAPDCTHTWVIGLDGSAKVEQIRVVEMKCHHAFPTNKPSFLDQFKGKGPAEVDSLKDSVTTIAKATGTCNLTTDAVIKSIKIAQAVLGS